MPFSYDYSEPERLISSARLSSYRTSIIPENDAQLFGAYSWNLAVVGVFYPLLQLIEVALRNAISNAAKEKIICNAGQHWFDCISYTQDTNDQGLLVNAEQVKKFKTKIKNAKNSAKKALKEKGIENPTPSLDQIISHTDFSTWGYILDKHFYNGSDNRFLWPSGLTRAFKKLPRTIEKNPMFHQRDIIRRRVEEIRSFRNRLSHNEPTWRVTDIQKRENVVSNLSGKLDAMMEMLFWLSPKFQKYVQDVGIEARIRQILNISELNRYMHVFERHSITEIDDLMKLTEQANSENIRLYFSVNDCADILMPHNTHLLQ
ncbi:Abi family protein [Photorhabdus sp. P32]|uniref:Abi family protein n=1 Tax=Photorhabdus sp. P32 TaxID=3117549 RepID=UPI00311B1863